VAVGDEDPLDEVADPRLALDDEDRPGGLGR
jgi:hypothetical protein